MGDLRGNSWNGRGVEVGTEGLWPESSWCLGRVCQKTGITRDVIRAPRPTCGVPLVVWNARRVGQGKRGGGFWLWGRLLAKRKRGGRKKCCKCCSLLRYLLFTRMVSLREAKINIGKATVITANGETSPVFFSFTVSAIFGVIPPSADGRGFDAGAALR